eukprot:2740927-Alexandrium_andersonii.AAC.1
MCIRDRAECDLPRRTPGRKGQSRASRPRWEASPLRARATLQNKDPQTRQEGKRGAAAPRGGQPAPMAQQQ